MNPRESDLPLAERLLNAPHGFDLFQAISLLEREGAAAPEEAALAQPQRLVVVGGLARHQDERLRGLDARQHFRHRPIHLSR